MASPVGITAAESSIREEGAMTRALIQTSGSWCLTICSSPANRTVTFSSDTHASSRAGRIHAVNCEKEEEAERESKWEFQEKSYQTAVYTNIFTQYLKVSTKKPCCEQNRCFMQEVSGPKRQWDLKHLHEKQRKIQWWNPFFYAGLH